MGVDRFPWVVVAYSIALYNYVLAGGFLLGIGDSGGLSTLFVILGTIAWITGGIVGAGKRVSMDSRPPSEQPLRRPPRPLDQLFELRPGDGRVDVPLAGRRAEAAVRRGEYSRGVPDHVGEPHDSVRDGVGVL